MLKCSPALADTLRQQGFAEGAPASVPAEVVLADRQIYASMKCNRSSCRGNRQKVTPYHRGCTYKLVCECRRCGNQVEC
ncbi:MAG TPA: hypothetical protein VMG10_32790 [Gemmataceae bacterium]|nr:hypothetical protein [Gemmataceae bacterium]